MNFKKVGKRSGTKKEKKVVRQNTKQIGEMSAAKEKINEERVMTRLTLCHRELNNLLYKTGKHATDRWSWSESEMVKHLLFECEKYEAERRSLVRKLKRKY